MKKIYCCERFADSVRKKEIFRARSGDETEWYIAGGCHIYYCPFCGKFIKGKGWGEFEKKYPPSRFRSVTYSSEYPVPRQFSFVKINIKTLPKRYHSKGPFEADNHYIFVSEIPNMPGHCIVLDKLSGKIYVGYHTDNFIELSDEET